MFISQYQIGPVPDQDYSESMIWSFDLIKILKNNTASRSIRTEWEEETLFIFVQELFSLH